MATINKQPNEINKKKTNDTNKEQVADILDMGRQLRLVVYYILVAQTQNELYTYSVCTSY